MLGGQTTLRSCPGIDFPATHWATQSIESEVWKWRRLNQVSTFIPKETYKLPIYGTVIIPLLQLHTLPMVGNAPGPEVLPSFVCPWSFHILENAKA